MKHYALIGEHLGHSLSVPIHQAVYEKLGIDADYRLIEIPKDGFDEHVRRLFAELDGFNITIPYKQDIMHLIDTIEPVAAQMGAVNTVTCRDGKNTGANTDAPGFEQMLRYHGINPEGKPCFVLGTGGASKAVIAALKGMGAASVTCVSRTAREGVITYQELPEAFSGILVNTTPSGMWPKVDGCPIDPDILPAVLKKADGVADVIYNPSETVLTRMAKEAGVPACTGLYMLIAQAV